VCDQIDIPVDEQGRLHEPMADGRWGLTARPRVPPPEMPVDVNAMTLETVPLVARGALEAAGLSMTRWDTDPEHCVALVHAVPTY
jgi:hypothetical protein